MKKKAFTIVLALSLFFSVILLVGCDYAKGEQGTDGLEYHALPDGTYAVKIGTAPDVEDVVIPAKYNGKKITQVLDAGFMFASNLKSITIPNSVTSIGSNAFYNCTRLKRVYYTGSEEDWAKISIGSNNSPLTNATKIYNYVPEEE